MSNSDVNILHTRVVTNTGGGPEKTIINSPRYLKEFGYSSACAYLYPPGDSGIEQVKFKAQQADCEMITIPDKGPLDFSLVRGLLKVCKQRNVSIWHGHDYKTNAIGLLLSRFHRMHLVTTVHGWVQQTSKTPLYYWIDRRAIRRHDHAICVSEDLYESCIQLGLNEKNCTLIDNAIDEVEYSRSRTAEEAKAEFGFAADRFRIGAVGRLADEKGFDLLIEAVSKLIRDGLNVELGIIGEGGQQEALQRQIDATGFQDRIHLLGYRSDTKDLYEAMDLFVLSSYREGLPNVVLEAMSMEVPVIATRIAGVPKLVRDRENGLLINPGSAGEIASSIEEVVQNRELRKKITETARRTIEEEFSFSIRMKKVRDIYDRILGSKQNS